MICIYKITCLINNKIYIGQTLNYVSRICHHKSKLKRNCNDNKYLQEDYNKYGLNNFTFEILEECKEENLLERETYWINYFGGKESEKLYNMLDKDGHNLELRHLNGIRHKDKIVSEVTRQKLSNAMKNKFSGNKNPNYNNHKLQGKNNPMYGYRKYSKDFIDKIRLESLEISKKDLAKKYNICLGTIYNLINYGVSQHPKTYK